MSKDAEVSKEAAKESDRFLPKNASDDLLDPVSLIELVRQMPEKAEYLGHSRELRHDWI